MLLARPPDARNPEILRVLDHSTKTPTMTYRFMDLKKILRNESLAPLTSCLTPLYSYLRAETGFLLAAYVSNI
jgi:hypothetical protein